MMDDANGLNVSRETKERLGKLASAIERWNPRINLVSGKTIPDLWNRHILDSIQLADHSAGAKTWVDLGSGGGFPGLVLAAMEEMAGTEFTLVESDSRKTAFLKEAARQMNIAINIRNQRIEEASTPDFDIVSARALAPLPKLLDYAALYLRPTGRCLFMKGANFEKELEDARKTWRFEVSLCQSRTDPQGRILVIEGLRRND